MQLKEQLKLSDQRQAQLQEEPWIHGGWGGREGRGRPLIRPYLGLIGDRIDRSIAGSLQEDPFDRSLDRRSISGAE